MGAFKTDFTGGWIGECRPLIFVTCGFCFLMCLNSKVFYVNLKALVYFYYWYISEDEGIERPTSTASCKFTAADIVRNRLLREIVVAPLEPVGLICGLAGRSLLSLCDLGGLLG